MIVNPQLFNYKLIIGSLLIAIVVIAAYSLERFSTLKDQEQFMEQEAKLVQNELSRMIELYDRSRVNIEELAVNLQRVESKTITLEDSLDLVKTNVPVISEYKKNMATLLNERRQLFIQIANVLETNDALKHAANTSKETLESQKLALKRLTEQNLELETIIENISALPINNLECKAYVINSIGYDIETFKASHADNMEVCFTVLKNQFTAQGTKDLYLQILGPDSTVVSNRGMVEFNKELVSYSGKTTINYSGLNLDVCAKINVNQEKLLKKGDYLISVFYDNTVLGTSKIRLN